MKKALIIADKPTEASRDTHIVHHGLVRIGRPALLFEKVLDSSTCQWPACPEHGISEKHAIP